MSELCHADGAADKLVGLKMTPSSDGVISVGETMLQEKSVQQLCWDSVAVYLQLF